MPRERPKFESVARNIIKIFPNTTERPKFKPFVQNLVNIFPSTVLQVFRILFLLNIRNSLTIQIVPSPSPLSTCQESHSALSVYMASGASLAEWHECCSFFFETFPAEWQAGQRSSYLCFLCYAKNSLFCFRPFPEVTLLARRR